MDDDRYQQRLVELARKNQRLDAVTRAGNRLEQALMELHRYHHPQGCEFCDALNFWWTTSRPFNQPTEER